MKRKRYRRKKKLHLKVDRQHPYVKNQADVQKPVKKLPTDYYVTDRLNTVIEQKECTSSVHLVNNCTSIQEGGSKENTWHYLEPDEGLSDTDHT